MALFIIDFDGTITSQNTHNAVSHLADAKMDDVWAVIKNIPPIESAKIWLSIFRSILVNGHSLAIASFNACGYFVIPKYLQDVIGLSEDELKHVHIESWLPLNPSLANKNVHIENIINDMNYNGCPDSIVLIDDDLKNIIAANKNGYRTIHATGHHMRQIECLSQDWSRSTFSNHYPHFFNQLNLDSQRIVSVLRTQCTIM